MEERIIKELIRKEAKIIAEQAVRDILASFLRSDRYAFDKYVEFSDGQNIQLGLSTGTKIGTATTQKIGFFNVTPVVQRTDMVALTDDTTGTANNTVQNVGGSFNQTILNDNFADLTAKINSLRTVLRDLGLMA